jgi:ATP-binding cassette subfamily F protein 3
VKSESEAITLNFKFNQQSGRHVKMLENVSKSYGKLEVLRPSTTGIERGNKIALIGANGIGKSTLLRIIANTESHGGKVETGYNVIPSFYAQHQIDALTLENEILDELKQAGTKKLEQELRMILGCFLFSGDDVFKKIKVLSGGEKSRVALAKTLISEANFLLLDEPTNHLDIISVNILVQALQQYKGTFVMVSHDRYFISEVANKIWYIDSQLIKEYPGTYGEFEIWRKKNQNISELSSQHQKSDSTLKKKKNKTNNADLKIINKITRLKKKLESTENEIEINEREISRIEEEMADVEIYSNPDKLAETNNHYENLKRKLEDKNNYWEQIAEEIEELE